MDCCTTVVYTAQAPRTSILFYSPNQFQNVLEYQDCINDEKPTWHIPQIESSDESPESSAGSSDTQEFWDSSDTLPYESITHDINIESLESSTEDFQNNPTWYTTTITESSESFFVVNRPTWYMPPASLPQSPEHLQSPTLEYQDYGYGEKPTWHIPQIESSDESQESPNGYSLSESSDTQEFWDFIDTFPYESETHDITIESLESSTEDFQKNLTWRITRSSQSMIPSNLKEEPMYISEYM